MAVESFMSMTELVAQIVVGNFTSRGLYLPQTNPTVTETLTDKTKTYTSLLSLRRRLQEY